MTLTLNGGPHGSCHFICGAETPPEEVRLRGPSPGTTVVYRLTGWKFREPYSDTWVYGSSKVTWEPPPRLVKFKHNSSSS